MNHRHNPVTRRVRILSNQYLDFALDGDARVLCWRVATDEVRMVDAFLALELEAETATHHGDLFIELSNAFTTEAEYPATLCRALTELYESERAALAREDLTCDWIPPEREKSESDQALLVRTCLSFAAHHAVPRHVVLVVRPTAVADVAAFQSWLIAFARTAPKVVRVITTDALESPCFTALTTKQDAKDVERVVTREAALDMPSAYAEISQSAGKTDTPGGQYREGFLQLGAALGTGNLDAAKQSADAALSIAQSERWFHMAVPICAALGSAYAAAGRVDDARAQFAAADASTLQGQLEGNPEEQALCRKLQMQCRLGLGSALITCKEYREAAGVFEGTIPLAQACGDDAVQLDCYRLAAFCHERADAPGEAFRIGYEGLLLAKRLPPEVIAMSALPHLGAALLNLCKPAERESLRDEIDAEIAKLTGDREWSAPFAEAASPA